MTITAGSIVSELSLWIPSIQNQLWWCFSSSQGNLEMLQEKIEAIPDHLSNIHDFPEIRYFRQCGHKNLMGAQRDKAWLSPNDLVSNTSLYSLASARLG